jgi:hypothetical protein
MADVFFSYSSKDRERVRPVHDMLTDAGFDVFWDQEVPPGQDWDAWIRGHLEKARCVVVFWSKSSVASENVRHEAIIARDRDLLLPVLIDRLGASDFPMGLLVVQAADLMGWTGDPDDARWVSFHNQLAERLTPAWMRRRVSDLDARATAERLRREAAEARRAALEAELKRKAESEVAAPLPAPSPQAAAPVSQRPPSSIDPALAESLALWQAPLEMPAHLDCLRRRQKERRAKHAPAPDPGRGDVDPPDARASSDGFAGLAAGFVVLVALAPLIGGALSLLVVVFLIGVDAVAAIWPILLATSLFPILYVAGLFATAAAVTRGQLDHSILAAPFGVTPAAKRIAMVAGLVMLATYLAVLATQAIGGASVDCAASGASCSFGQRVFQRLTSLSGLPLVLLAGLGVYVLLELGGAALRRMKLAKVEREIEAARAMPAVAAPEPDAEDASAEASPTERRAFVLRAMPIWQAPPCAPHDLDHRRRREAAGDAPRGSSWFRDAAVPYGDPPTFWVLLVGAILAAVAGAGETTIQVAFASVVFGGVVWLVTRGALWTLAAFASAPGGGQAQIAFAAFAGKPLAVRLAGGFALTAAAAYPALHAAATLTIWRSCDTIRSAVDRARFIDPCTPYELAMAKLTSLAGLPWALLAIFVLWACIEAAGFVMIRAAGHALAREAAEAAPESDAQRRGINAQ